MGHGGTHAHTPSRVGGRAVADGARCTHAHTPHAIAGWKARRCRWGTVHQHSALTNRVILPYYRDQKTENFDVAT
eukprot:scaffold16844_cov32-Tisochrysis_lutea.AAC.1